MMILRTINNVAGVLVSLSLCTIALGQNDTNVAPKIFVSNYLERADASTARPQLQFHDVVSIFAAPGEYEPATLSVRAGCEALKDVSVKLGGDLMSESGVTISADAVQIRLVQPLERWKDREFSSPIGQSESETHKQREWLLPLLKDTVNIEPHTTRRFWLTVHVPKSAKSGIYRGKIDVEHAVTHTGPDLGRRISLGTVKLEITVLPIHLASVCETGMAFFMYNNTAYYAPELATEEYQQRVLSDMCEHGMTTATLYVYPQVREKRVDLKAPTQQQLSFTQWMRLLNNTGFPAPGVPVLWIGAENYDADVWKAILEESEQRKWPEIVFYAVDEPGEEDRNVRVRAFMEKFNAFRREHPQYRARVTTAIGSTLGAKTVGHHYDFWIACMDVAASGENPLIESAGSLQKQPFCTYDCMLAPVDAETDRYYFGIWAWVSGVRGCAHWAYFDGGPRLSYVYPASNEIIPTIGWEAVREGIDDYRYFFTLKRLVDAARAAGKAHLTERAERIFAEVRGMVTVDRYGLAYLQAQENGIELASAYHRPRPELEMDIAAYDRLRRRVAEEIQELSQALGESAPMAQQRHNS